MNQKCINYEKENVILTISIPLAEFENWNYPIEKKLQAIEQDISKRIIRLTTNFTIKTELNN